MDAALTDGGPDAAPRVEVHLESARYIGDGCLGGYKIDENFWRGWRFEVPAGGMEVDTIGFHGHNFSGLFFAAIVALTSSDDLPDDPMLRGDDLLVAQRSMLPNLTAGKDVSMGISPTPLSAGWYGLVIGAGAFGADGVADAWICDGHTAVPGAADPFSIMQSTGDMSSVAPTQRFFVRGTAPTR